jgi:uncharacterized protein (TIGR03000 family)
MLARIRTTLVMGCALAGLALAAAPGRAQYSDRDYYPYYNYSTRGNPVPEQSLPDRAALRDWYNRVPPRYASYYISPHNPPTNMTSINYPLVYGAYIYPFPMGNYVYGALPTRFSNAPTTYGDYYTGMYTASWSRPSDEPARTQLRNSAAITVYVPAGALLRFNGKQTLQRGETRHFNVADLIPATTYAYDVTAVWTENGRQVAKNREVTFQAGDDVTIDFLSPEPERAILKTHPLSDTGIRTMRPQALP